MAKDEKVSKESPDERVKRLLLEVFALTLFVFLLARLALVYLNKGSEFDIRELLMSFLNNLGLIEFFKNFSFYATIIGIIVSAILIAGIIYISIKLRGIKKIWHDMLYPAPSETEKEEVKNEKWQRIISHINSGNSSDWRLAILECDIVLDELFDKLGYVGGTLGDKLKSVDPAHFKTLDSAWEAHKIRNAIAHEGQDFSMTDREAKRVVGLYESVFREFDFI